MEIINTPWIIEDLNVEMETSTTYNINSSPVQNQDYDKILALRIRVLDSPSLNSIEDVQSYLKGIPKWCTPDMLEEALRGMYPEHYL